MLDVESVDALDTDGTKHAEKCICLIDGGWIRINICDMNINILNSILGKGYKGLCRVALFKISSLIARL